MVLALFVSCNRSGRVIPRGRMTRMYAEMLMTDQWISSHYSARRQADTSFVYGPVLEKYGYDADDWRASVAHYLRDPQRYARMFANVGDIIKDRESELVALDNARRAAREYLDNLERFKPEKIYTMSGLFNKETFCEGALRYYVDTTGGDWRFDPSKGADTIYHGPMLIWPEDSTAIL